MAAERAYNDAKRGIRYRPPPAVAGAPAPVFWLTPADGREVLCVLHEGCVPDLHQGLQTQGTIAHRVSVTSPGAMRPKKSHS